MGDGAADSALPSRVAMAVGTPPAAHNADGDAATAERESRLRAARDHRLPRLIGHTLAAICIAPVLVSRDAPVAMWLLLVLNCALWPHAAWMLATRAQDPLRAEFRNLVLDCVAGGAWIAAMAFNLMPSAVLCSLLMMDRACAGGPRLALRGFVALAASSLVTAALLGFPFDPATSLAEMLGTLPFLVLYPVFVGNVAFRLGQRVREQNRLLAALSRTDGLSGLLNRSHWEALVADELGRRRRHHRPASLIMLDVDHFKSVNDRHGHLVGDDVIRRVARLLTDAIRASDVAGRYGGEEFCVLLPDTTLAGAQTIAERIRRTIEASVIDPELDIRCTVSLGVAEALIDAGPADARAWIARADRALYRAKAEGRNRTVLAD